MHHGTHTAAETSSIERGLKSDGTDEAFLASLGYKQEFRREFTALEVFGVAFSIIGVVPSIASVLVYAIPNGGTSAMVWGWAVSSFLILFIGLAMAELGSAAPTSGGLYYWTHSFSSPNARNLLSWIVGYSNTIGIIAGVASVDWGCAVQIMAAVSIGSNMTFAPTTAQIFGVYAALLLCHSLIASLATRALARLQNLYIVLNILLCLAIVIALPAATPKKFKNSASYALGGFQNFNGWPDGYAFILSFLAPLWSIGAYDSSVHISEESTNARVAVPFAIISSISLAGVLGWAINMALAFNMGNDLEGILASPIGQPLATIFFNSFGQKGTLVLWSFIVIVQFMMGTSVLLASSRQTFAFARDGGLPFSSWIYRINAYTKTPVNGVWFAAFIALLLGLLSFAGPAAITAIFALAVAGQNVAYSIPITARFAFKNDFKPGPFCLGRFSLPVAVVAVLWMIFTTTVFFFPSTPQTNAASMNYTVVVLGGSLLLSLVYYYFPKYGGVHWFKGPVANILESTNESLCTTEKQSEDIMSTENAKVVE
ncbi:amino acid transporter [Rickenella mellea]|uniref:Amino acid transporter n=1 Tax=Rickenella mellea TaxID=50990 RepID=A0A4Y7QAJ3_9AGAM|nr:amino acid transporter [Rickenella mellea]